MNSAAFAIRASVADSPDALWPAPAIAVLVSQRIDPVSGRPTRHRNDALAAAIALAVASRESIRLLHAGEMSESVARDYLAIGADSITLMAASQDVVMPLAAALASTPLVLTGTRCQDGMGSGVLPYALAAALGRPVIADVMDMLPSDAGGQPGWVVTQALPRGARRRLAVSGPAVLAISPLAAMPLRHSHADRMAGRIDRQGALSSPAAVPYAAKAASASTACPGSAAVQRVPAARRLQPLQACVAQSGHARMQAAVGTPAATGGIVITTGSAHDKARAVLQYLRDHALVNF
jgi:electron transfer flavoprotein beta subunit